MKNNWKTGVLFFCISLTLFFFFQNCGAQKPAQDQLASQADGNIQLDRAIATDEELNRSFGKQAIHPATSAFTGYDIIVIAGQSNAVGAGKSPAGETWIDPLKNESPELDERIFQVGRYEDDLKLVPATDTLQHFGFRDEKDNIGFGMSFARRYVAGLGTGRKVIMVPAAMGGTSIHEWLGEHPVIDKVVNEKVSLLDSLKERLVFALNRKGENQRELQNRFVAVLWQHGEADIRKATIGEDAMTADLYVRKMNRVFETIKSYAPDERVSFLIGEPVPGWTVVENSQINVEREKLKFKSAIVNYTAKGFMRKYVRSQSVKHEMVTLTSNCESKSGNDCVHYDAQSQIELGQLYYNAYKDTVAGGLAGMRITNSASFNASARIVDPINMETTGVPTHLLDLGISGLPVKLGIDARGGGYVNYMEIFDKGVNRVAPKFGRGMQTAIRDRYHSFKYNPTQAGYKDDWGARVTVTEVKSESGKVTSLKIPQFNIPLWNGDGGYDYVQAPKSEIGQPEPYDDVGDWDLLDEAGKAGSDEVKSEFDYAGKFDRATEEFGIPAFRHSFYFAYQRSPSAILQFTNPQAKTRPHEDEKESVFVLNDKRVIEDVSSAEGLQTPNPTDMSDVIFRTFSGRIQWDKELFNNFYYYYQVAGRWKGYHMPLDPSTGNKIAGLKGPPYLELLNFTNNFKFKDGRNVQTEGGEGDRKEVLTSDLLIVSNVCNSNWITNCPAAGPKRSIAMAYYYPIDDHENKYPVVVMNRGDLTIHSEESRIVELGFTMGYRDLSDIGYITPKMELRLSGILSPLRYKQDLKKDRFEAVRQKIYVLFGHKPADIIQAVDKFKAANKPK